MALGGAAFLGDWKGFCTRTAGVKESACFEGSKGRNWACEQRVQVDGQGCWVSTASTALCSELCLAKPGIIINELAGESLYARVDKETVRKD